MHCSNCSASVEKHFNKQKDMLPLVGLLNESLEKDNFLLKELQNRLGVNIEDIIDYSYCGTEIEPNIVATYENILLEEI